MTEEEVEPLVLDHNEKRLLLSTLEQQGDEDFLDDVHQGHIDLAMNAIYKDDATFAACLVALIAVARSLTARNEYAARAEEETASHAEWRTQLTAMRDKLRAHIEPAFSDEVADQLRQIPGAVAEAIN